MNSDEGNNIKLGQLVWADSAFYGREFGQTYSKAGFVFSYENILLLNVELFF